jgi:glycerol kinase
MFSRPFAVGVYVGRRIVSWPFGRLDVKDDSLSVRSRPSFQLARREALRENVEAISIVKRSGTTLLRIRDTGNVFSDIIVQIPLRSAKIVHELRRQGYPVVEEER